MGRVLGRSAHSVRACSLLQLTVTEKESGENVVSPFTDHQETRNQLIMQSVENGHGWTVSIDRRDGRI
jgi:hypothetical protein